MTTYLIHYTDLNNNRPDRYVVQDIPGRKNLSGETCVDGWLGSTNNISATAWGEFAAVEEAIAAARRGDMPHAPIFEGIYDDGFEQVYESDEPIA